MMTDGTPTDDLAAGLAAIRSKKFGMIIACAAGANANVDSLRQITESIVSLDTADSSTISAFFKWVSASISTGSQKVEASGKEVAGLQELPPPPPEINIVV